MARPYPAGQTINEVRGEGAMGSIPPHPSRHGFATMVLRSSGNHLKLGQEEA